MAHENDWIIDALSEIGILSGPRAEKIKARAGGEDPVELAMELEIVNDVQVAIAKASHFGTDFFDLGNPGTEIPKRVIDSVPKHILAQYQDFIPLEKYEGVTVIGVIDPSDLDMIDGLGHLLHSEITLKVVTPTALAEALKKYYGIERDPNKKKRVESESYS